MNENAIKSSKTSLLTVMCYFQGATLNLTKLKDGLWSNANVKNPPLFNDGSVNFKELKAPKNTIITVQSSKMIKGVENLKSRNPCDDLYDVHYMDGTVEEKQHYSHDMPSNENIDYLIRKADRKFPNNVTIIYSCEPGTNINMFVFDNNIKIAGFKKQKNCETMVRNLWRKFFVPIPGAIQYDKGNDEKIVRMTFESSMTNIKYNTNVSYCFPKLNDILNDLRDDETSPVISSYYEPSSITGIMIKLQSDPPIGKQYVCWKYNGVLKTFEKEMVERFNPKRKSVENNKLSIKVYDDKLMCSFRHQPTIPKVITFVNDILSKYSKDINIYKMDDEKIGTISAFYPK